jgi:exonuclease VII small subunit
MAEKTVAQMRTEADRLRNRIGVSDSDTRSFEEQGEAWDQAAEICQRLELVGAQLDGVTESLERTARMLRLIDLSNKAARKRIG